MSQTATDNSENIISVKIKQQQKWTPESSDDNNHMPGDYYCARNLTFT